jgi:hypothetical protein
MRRVFASFRFKSETLQKPIVLGLQLHQRGDRRDGGNHGARLAATKRCEAVKTKVESWAMNAAKHAGNFARQSVVDVADKTQREMIVLRVYPSRTRQAAAHRGQRSAHCRRELNSGEQAGHNNLRAEVTGRAFGYALYGFSPGDSQ